VCRIQDFGVDGGGALKSMEPKIELFRQHVQETLHFSLPVVEVHTLSEKHSAHQTDSSFA
jgi:hypothetical protein